MAIGLESAKIKSQKLSRMSFHKNFTPQKFYPAKLSSYTVSQSSFYSMHDPKLEHGVLTHQGIKVTSELLKSTNSECGCNLTFDPWKSIDQKPQKGLMKRSNTCYNCSCKHFNRWHKFVEGSHTPSYHPFQALMSQLSSSSLRSFAVYCKWSKSGR